MATKKPKRVKLVSDLRIDEDVLLELAHRGSTIQKPRQWFGIAQQVIINRALKHYFAKVKSEPPQEE